MNSYETKRLILRPYVESDFEAVHSYSSCYENIEYMLWGPNEEKDTRAFISFAIKKANENPCRDYQFAVELKEKGILIGGCSITLINDNQAEIGWVLHRDFWKHGYGTEIGEFLICFGFEELKLHRIIATCASENYGSYRVMENNGMRREGCFLKARVPNKMSNEKWCDEYSYAIIKEEYIKFAKDIKQYLKR